MPLIPAAGTLPWRRRRGVLEVALVHRPKYDDWAWAKGKLDPGEDYAVAAVRETFEETALEVRLGRPLPTSEYRLIAEDGLPAAKRVEYWAAEVTGGDGVLRHEIDQVCWLPVQEAHDRLDYERDRDQLRALLLADQEGGLSTWPLVLVRHGKAVARGSWHGLDADRPLEPRGRDRARAIVPLLGAYGVRRLVSSPSVRCVDTLRPYAAAIGRPLRLKDGLSEEGFEADPARPLHHLERIIERGAAAALCSHGPVLPVMLRRLGALLDPSSRDAAGSAAALEEAAGPSSGSGMDKGEVLVAHLVDSGEQARVVAVERHLP